jgi:cytoskeleton protein RodZ
VFVRGQLRSYSRLLGIELDLDVVRQEVGSVVPAELVSHGHTPRYQRVFEHATRRAVYIAITAVIAVPVWLATRPHLSNGDLNVQSLDVQAVSAAADRTPPPVRSVPERTPLIASMGAMRSTAEEAPALSLTFSGDSWVQVFDSEGDELEQGLLANGDRRSYDKGEIGQVVLGNASAVEVRRNGKRVDLAPFSRANVARFTLSSDGSLAPAVD